MIESCSNNLYKKINKLTKKKYRNKYNLFYIETKKLVKEAINSNCDIECIVVNEENVGFDCENYEKVVFSNQLFSKISNLESEDGVSAIVRMKKNNSTYGEKILLLDFIQDPGNMGTILRSAEAFGFFDVLLINNCVDIYNLKTLRASMGSIFRINVVDSNINEIKILKKDYKVFTTDMYGIDYRNIEKDAKIILAIGNEANGISKEVFEISDKKIKIPMEGKIESLNAAIAASILMHGLNR